MDIYGDIIQTTITPHHKNQGSSLKPLLFAIALYAGFILLFYIEQWLFNKQNVRRSQQGQKKKSFKLSSKKPSGVKSLPARLSLKKKSSSTRPKSAPAPSRKSLSRPKRRPRVGSFQ